nr:MAG TPA: hypothetical protein [Microviridae sp.]
MLNKISILLNYLLFFIKKVNIFGSLKKKYNICNIKINQLKTSNYGTEHLF